MSARTVLLSHFAEALKAMTFQQFAEHYGERFRVLNGGTAITKDAYRHARKAILSGVPQTQTTTTERSLLEPDPVPPKDLEPGEIYARVKTLEELLEQSKVDLDKWEVVSWRPAVSEQGQKMVGSDGVTRPTLVQLWHVKALLQRRLDHKFQPIMVGQPIHRKPKPDSKVKKVMFVPDTHHGYRWDEEHNYMEPLHDRQACDAVLEAARRIQPDEIHFHGDNIDNAESSTRWPKTIDLYATLQPSLYEFNWYLRQFREACPHARIVWHEGNHEHRIAKLLRESAPALERLTAVGDKLPALHWSRLLGLEALDVEYVSEYPSTSWVWDMIKVHHGTVVRGGSGATTGAVARSASYHEVFGHTHRVEVTPRTFETPAGPKTVWVMSTGTLARLDGVVPGGDAGSNWQQGFGLAYLDPSGNVHMQAVAIVDGRCMVEGSFVEGRNGESVASAAYNAIGQARGRAWPIVKR